jgi:hypothetical protein
MTDTHVARIGRLPVGLKRLWVGVLAAPSAWVLAELVGYYLSSRSCEWGVRGIPLVGTAHPALTQVVLEAVMLAIAVVGLVVAVSNWRALHPQPERNEEAEWGRAHFMAFGGVLLSALFIGGILLFALSPFFLNACSQAR